MLDEDKTVSNDEQEKCLKDLRAFLEADENFKNWKLHDECIGRYLRSSGFDLNTTVVKLKHLYCLLKDYPDWCRMPSPLQMRHIIEENIQTMIPSRDKAGRPIYISKIGNINVSKVNILDISDLDDVWMEYLLLKEPRAAEKGLCVIVDIANLNWKLLKWTTPENIKLGINKLQSLPFREYRFHVVNNSIALQILIGIIWPVLPQHIKRKVKFHFDNWESLLEHIDIEALPMEYNGHFQINYRCHHNLLIEMNDEIVSSWKKYRVLENDEKNS